MVNLLFQGGVTASFTMCAFTYEMTRTITLMGTRGQITGDMIKNEIEVRDFLTGECRKHVIETGSSGHSGSGEKFMEGFIRTVETNGAYSLSGAEASIESHMIAFAAEESRLTGKTVYMDEYCGRFS